MTLVRNTGCESISEVGLLEALDRLERTALGIACKAPRTDRGADKVDGPAQTGDKRIYNDPVELAQDQPFRPAGGARHGTNQFRRESVFMNCL
jgi:hypothetical protein